MGRASTAKMTVGWNCNWGVDGRDLTGQGNDLKHDRSTKQIEGKAFGKQGVMKKAGQQDLDIDIKGNYASGELLNGFLLRRYGRDMPVNLFYGLEGLDYGLDAVVQPSSLTSYTTSVQTDDPCTYESKWSSAEGDVWDGKVHVSPNGLITGTTFTSTPIDNTLAGGATSAGGALFLSVWNIKDGTNPTVTAKLQGTADISGTPVWDDLCTTTAIGKRKSALVVLDPSAVVPIFTRVMLTIAGTPANVQVLAIGARGINPNDPNLV